jgi:hydrogenase expression/formation protein HypC
MQLIAFDPEQEEKGFVDLDGSHYRIDLSLVEGPALGDYLIVHAGYAIEKLDCQEAQLRLDLFERLADQMAAETGAEVRLINPRIRRNGGPEHP